ncbi:D-alanine--D-alanine ligase [Aquipluma nitroreducens]|uniref:D-alanine--D-alanine ligase n=1 Tax=Aquipluma nitroreducens TaxID=2010828 RepID=A0A5K7S6S0_9BACT|nr:D-alanine--D-alanine ligase [Aquipluma nitroreducens]BBE17209.1 D-alanine--D-alanine ligase [Aquipluma nitroreducens]
MKKNIAVVYGGDSSEFVVSVKSSKNVFESIDPTIYNVWKVQMQGLDWVVFEGDEIISPIDKSDFSFIKNGNKIHFDFAYITIHGTPGEDGKLQGYFDLVKIPYSTCGVYSSALTFNKYFCSNYLRNFNVPMAKSVRLFKGDSINPDKLVEELGLPVFVKPNAGGSSFGVTKVKEKAQLQEALELAMKESSDILVEEFIEGKEFTCGLVKLSNQKILFPVTEVIPQNEFFDYEAKYVAGKTDEITPARISPDMTNKIQQLSSRIYDLCDCSGIVRVDYILKDGEFYFLEVNTTPGMTATSFVPQQIAAMGRKLSDVLGLIIEDKLK